MVVTSAEPRKFIGTASVFVGDIFVRERFLADDRLARTYHIGSPDERGLREDSGIARLLFYFVKYCGRTFTRKSILRGFGMSEGSLSCALGVLKNYCGESKEFKFVGMDDYPGHYGILPRDSSC